MQSQDITQLQQQEMSEFERPEESGSAKVVKWIVVALVVAVLILAGLYIVSKYTRFNVLGLSSTNSTWQAVFLSNGQVYFGKVVKADDEVVVLREIYYLQVTQPLQRSNSQEKQQPTNELSLIKLGNELHGPQDEMRINYQHVLFIEDLKPDSKVVQAIENYKADRQ